ncbi:MAG: four helix bundle protein [Chloroflexota bacterium]
MYKGANIQHRLIQFASRIVKVCKSLPKDQASRHIANQILRSGTSPAPNYGEARAAESKRDFVHKLKIALKELNETSVWLEIMKECQMADDIVIKALLDESQQLARILSASINTARNNMKR